MGIRYPRRFAFAAAFCAFNFAYAAYIAYSKFRDPKKTVTHIVLLILAGNLFLYIFYYVFRKNQLKCRHFCQACKSEDTVDAR